MRRFYAMRPLGLTLLMSFALCLMAFGNAQAGPQHITSAKPPIPRGGVQVVRPTSSLAQLARKFNKNAETAAVLIDVRTGKVLEVHNPIAQMPPASVTKVVTTLYGIEQLGQGYQFTTRVLATGPQMGGIIQGDLVLIGGGDPSLDSDELARMIKIVREAGIKGVTGQFLYYDQALPYAYEIDDGQPVEAAYNPAVSGLNLNFNRVHLQWADGGLNVSARAENHAPSVRGVHVETSQRSGPIYQFDEKGGADHWSLAAPAFKKSGAAWLPVRHPAPYAAEVFRTLSQEYGLILPYPVRAQTLPKGDELARNERRELNLVSRGMLHFSTNLTAEVIGLTASGQGGLASSGIAMQIWAKQKYGLKAASFRDHSGLGDFNRISAGEMASIVAQAGKAGDLDGLLRRYFVSAAKGNKPAVKGAEVRAKTGTLNFVRGLSGLIHGAHGQTLAFAIFSADLDARAKIDGTNTRQPGAKRFANRARSFEQAVLRRWLLAHGA